jgi:hypothetical protein
LAPPAWHRRLGTAGLALPATDGLARLSLGEEQWRNGIGRRPLEKNFAKTSATSMRCPAKC